MFATGILILSNVLGTFAAPRLFGLYETKGGGNNNFKTLAPFTRPPTYRTYPTKGPVPIKPVTKDPCIGKEYSPDPKNCNIFYQCTGGKMVALPCPPGLYWNQKDLMCDWPEQVNRPECPQSVQSKACNTAPNSAGFVCPAPMGWFEDIKGDCTSFYMCDHCEAKLKKCPNGLAWNQKLTTCDWPGNVKGCKTSDGNSQHTQKPLPPVVPQVTQQTTRRTTTTTRRTTLKRRSQATVFPTRSNIKGGWSGNLMSSNVMANLWANNNGNMWRNNGGYQ